MTDLSDINMDGVKPMGDMQELGIGQYLVRIEDTDKKETKEKFAEDGSKLPPNYYLQIALQVYGGPNEGQIEFTRLNLWNPNETAQRMAKSELKSIQEATGVISTNSDHLHGKWMILEIKAGVKDPSKHYKYYSPAAPEIVAQFAHIPPVPAKAPSPAASQPVQHTAAPAATGVGGGHYAPPAAAAKGAMPSWAQKK